MKSPMQVSILFSFVLILFLTGCIFLSPKPANDLPSPNETPATVVPTMFVPTMTAFSTSTLMPTDTLTALLPTVTSTPLPFALLDGLHVAYTISGNLFSQESGGKPVQLTNSGQDRNPTFSDDGQKIAFLREWETQMNELYVINSDGTREKLLVSFGLLTGYNESTEPDNFAFIPGTHLLLLNTHSFDQHYPKGSDSHWGLNYDLLLVNTDTGELRQLKSPGQGGFFLPSPNGKYIAFQTRDHVDVIDMQGRYVLNNLFSHSPDAYDCDFYGYICAPMYWKKDSSELILAQPIEPSGGGQLARTIWRYPITGATGRETQLTPVNPWGEDLSLSPDGNWIVFSAYDQGSSDGVYIGNLSDGTSQRIYQPATGRLSEFRLCDDGWSLDSFYFVCHDDFGSYLVNIRGETVPLTTGRISAWIDASHYLSGTVVVNLKTGEEIRVVEDISLGIDPDSFTFVLPK